MTKRNISPSQFTNLIPFLGFSLTQCLCAPAATAEAEPRQKEEDHCDALPRPGATPRCPVLQELRNDHKEITEKINRNDSASTRHFTRRYSPLSISMVNLENVEGYKPPQEFEEENKKALVNLNMNDSTELWLLKLPVSNDLLSEIDGQELSVNLHTDGKLAAFDGSSGKEYDFVSFASQEPDEIVFVASPTEPKIAGKISRRVSIVHYPDPKELEKSNAAITRHTHKISAGGTMATSSRYFPMQSGNPRSSQSGLAASSKGSRKSSLSEVSEPSNAAERKPVSKKDKSSGRKVSGISHGHSTGISSMSSDHSHGGKSKRRKHEE